MRDCDAIADVPIRDRMVEVLSDDDEELQLRRRTRAKRFDREVSTTFTHITFTVELPACCTVRGPRGDAALKGRTCHHTDTTAE